MLAVFGFSDTGEGRNIGEAALFFGSAVETNAWQHTNAVMLRKCREDHPRSPRVCGIVGSCKSVLGRVIAQPDPRTHYTQMLSITSPTGISETLSDCLRISKAFKNTAAFEAGLQAGFPVHSLQLQAVLPPPVAQLAKVAAHRHRHIERVKKQWKATDATHYETVAERCRAVVLTAASEVVLNRVGALNDTLSVALHTAVRNEHEAAKKCAAATAARSL